MSEYNISVSGYHKDVEIIDKSIFLCFLSLSSFQQMCCAVLCSVLQSFLTLCDPMDSSLPGSSVHGNSPGNNTGVGCYFLLQGIFPTQWSNPRLLHLLYWQVNSFYCATWEASGHMWMKLPVFYFKPRTLMKVPGKSSNLPLLWI